jgi:hypothetical protein
MSWRITPSFTQWTPALLSTALWLDAADATTLFTTDSGSTLATNGSAVGRWNDKSGNGRNFIQATAGVRPTYTTAAQNSRNVVTVSTLGQFLTYSSGGLLSNVSGGFICAAGACTATTSTFKFYLTITTAAIGTRFSLTKDTSNFSRTGGRRLTSDAFASINGSVNIGTAGNILFSSVNYAATTLTLFRNGAQDATKADFQSAGSTPNDAGNASLFNNIFGDTNNFTGSMFEVIVGHSTPSTLDRQKLEGYLAHKWGLTANLPDTHPYKYQIPTPGV